MFYVIFTGEAQKLKGSGKVTFEVCIDENGEAFVTMIANSDAGTFAERVYFPMSTVMALRKAVSANQGSVSGVRNDGTKVTAEDLNVPGFLKAIGHSLTA